MGKLEDLEAKALALGKKNAKQAASDVVSLVPDALAVAAEKIPGQVDDVILAALGPVLQSVLQGLVDKMGA